MVALLVASPVAAQEVRGSIEGIVRDTSGAVLPGVTVEAKARTGRPVDYRLTPPAGGTVSPPLRRRFTS